MSARHQQQQIGKAKAFVREPGRERVTFKVVTAISGLSLAIASALAVTRPTITPPISPGPAVAAIASTSARVMPASASVAPIKGVRRSAWARAAISGTTPP
jgi:hypothetical protein